MFAILWNSDNILNRRKLKVKEKVKIKDSSLLADRMFQNEQKKKKNPQNEYRH